MRGRSEAEELALILSMTAGIGTPQRRSGRRKPTYTKAEHDARKKRRKKNKTARHSRKKNRNK